MLTSYIADEQSAREASYQHWLLALDTSTELAGIALYDGERVHQSSWSAGREQSTQVLSRVHQHMEVLGIGPQDLGAVAVATGPGSFTGLRVGLSLAKGIALGGGIPIVGIPTLQAIALPWLLAGVSVIAVLPAGRGRVVWQRFRIDHLAEDEALEPRNTDAEELKLVADSAGVHAIVGELPPSLAAMLTGSHVPMATQPSLGSRIGSVAMLGWWRYLQGESDDLAVLEPTYVHGVPKSRMSGGKQR